MALVDNLISYWNLQSNANDSVGSNSGTASNVTFGGSDASFNGSNSGITLPGYTVGTFTMAIWVKFTSGSPQTEVWRTANMSTQSTGFSNNRGANGRVDGYTFQSPTFTDLEWNTTVNDGNWHLIVLTRSGSNGEFFVDNVSRGTTSSFSSITMGNASQNSFGYNRSNSSSYYNGFLRYAGLWDRVLTSGELTQLYNGGAGLPYPFPSTFTASPMMHQMLITGGLM